MSATAHPQNLDLALARQTAARQRHFADLPGEVLEAVARNLSIRKYSTGQVICLEGDTGEYLYLLEKGWVKTVRTALDGREQAAMLLQGGEMFGAEAIFSRASQPVTVVALEDVSAWAIPAETLKTLVRHHPALAVACLEHLAVRVVYYIQLVEDLGLRSVQARLAFTLLNHAELREGRLVVLRRTWATLDEMASRLGTVRDVVSRALNQLQKEGILQLERSQIIILDPQKLFEHGRV